MMLILFQGVSHSLLTFGYEKNNLYSVAEAALRVDDSYVSSVDMPGGIARWIGGCVW